MKPYYETIPNPLHRPGHGTFDGFELQTVQEFEDASGYRYFEIVVDDEQEHADSSVGPVMIGVYGHMDGVGVEHIADFYSIEQAHEFLYKMGIITGR